ncbi:MAG: pyridoxal-5'-phosphate-dependent protein, partial [Planctomycetota bacterium]
DELPGALLHLLQSALGECNIVDFQYGKTGDRRASPVIGFDAPDEVLAGVIETCRKHGVAVQDVSQEDDVRFRVLRFDPATFTSPIMLRYDFPERAGALHEFLECIRDVSNICYFNYRYSGEPVGRALIGLEFASTEDRRMLLERFEDDALLRGRHHVLSAETSARMLGSVGD